MLSFPLGAVVGLSLGLTGGGGAIFAVPLLVYGLDLAPRTAVGVSLVTVGATAAVGCLQRFRAQQVELPTGLLFAGAGMLSAPLGAWLARRLPEPLLLLLFAALMATIAVRMARSARKAPAGLASTADALDDNAGPSCRRDPEGKLRLTSRCATVLAGVGLGTGVLTGLFGVGGGFIIVPALVTFSGMGMQRAVGTSLLVISLVSVSGIVSHFAVGEPLPVALTLAFLAGSVAGLWGGTRIARRLSGPRLQQVFAAAILAVATLVFAQNWGAW
jgi:uncharacterized membrane protein YfcA